MLTIRRFNFREDIHAIIKIEKEVFAQDAFHPLEFLYLQQIGKDLFLVAILDNEIVGYISAYRQENKAYIASIAVHNNFRRRGIAKRLMQDILKRLNLLSSIELHVRQGNFGAIKFYQGFGFDIADVEVDYYPDEDAFIMVLNLIK